MDNKINAWLEDIIRSIDEIFEFLPEKRDFFEYKNDLKTKKAVNRISSYKKSDLTIKNAQKIIGTRNRIAHEYDFISDELIWTIVVKELPELKKKIENLME